MRSVSLWLCLLAASLASAAAQVAVQVVLDQGQFLPSEPIVAAVRVANRSGQTLHLGQTQEWLSLSVEGRDGLVVAKTDEVPVVGEFTLGSSRVVTQRWDLSPYFTLTRPGRYAVTATVRVKEWDKEFSSPAKGFDIIGGIKLWEQEFGVPLPSGAATGSPEVRKYSLQQANYLKQLKLYARVTDATDTRVFRVQALGPLVSFGRPEPGVDAQSNLHVLFQTGARSFRYCVLNPKGEEIRRETHDLTGSRPHLKPKEDGSIVVTGGTRRVTLDDLPPPPSADSTNEVSAPKP